jgi:hypothetical protein
MPELAEHGCQIVDAYFDAQRCEEMLGGVRKFQNENDLTEINRPMKPRPLRYKVIDGHQIEQGLAGIWDLYHGEILDIVTKNSGLKLRPLGNQQAGVNINIMAPQKSSYRWHYDRNDVTAILYLNSVEGGETELYPNYRILVGKNRGSLLQQWLDKALLLPPVRSLFGTRMRVEPEVGKLVMMRGNRCWHSVRPVIGDVERVNIIFAFEIEGKNGGASEELDTYLYTTKESGTQDPNYSK